MKKKINLGLVIVLIVLLITACSTKTEDVKKEETNFSDKSIAANGLKIEPEKGLEIVTNPAEFTKVSDNQEYNFETDCQNQFSELIDYNDCIETKDSYIFLRHSHLFVFSKSDRKYSILCDNPSCDHGYVESCSAFINAKGIEYYNGSIYALVAGMEPDENGGALNTLELYKISLNGHDRERICQIATARDVTGMDTNTFSVWCAVIHRGYLYYMYTYGVGETEDSYYVNHSNTLYRISLSGDSEPECICAMNYGGNPNHIYLHGKGSYVYFIQVGNMEYGIGYLYRINTESMKLEYIDIGEVRNGYTIIGNEIIYTKEEGIYYTYNSDTGEKYEFLKLEPIENMGYGYTIYDGRYLYILVYNEQTNKRYLDVYTLQKEKIDQYECTDIVLEKDTGTCFVDYLGAGSDFDFMSASDGSVLMYLDKNQLGSGNVKFVWTE